MSSFSKKTKYQVISSRGRERLRRTLRRFDVFAGLLALLLVVAMIVSNPHSYELGANRPEGFATWFLLFLAYLPLEIVGLLTWLLGMGDLIRSAIEFDDVDALDVCTPRIDIVGVEEGATNDEVVELFDNSGFSRLPVYRQSIDHVIGVINQKDFYRKVIHGGEPLESIVCAPLYIPSGTRISKLMRMFQQQNTHIAIIIDEYGGTMGLATLEDVIEELIGEIWDEHDEVIHEIEELSPGVYKVLGSAHTDNFFETFGIHEEAESNSVNGWLLSRIEHIPEAGETFDYKNLHIEVLKATDRKVEVLKVTLRDDDLEEMP